MFGIRVDRIWNHLSSNTGESRTLEFGEYVVINSIAIKDTGHMPLPRQRILFTIKESQGVATHEIDRLFMTQDLTLRPRGTGRVHDGFLRFYCSPFTSNSND
eukprot:scaffold5612_cov150-Amphora_coffeaeformis.AAC.2